MEFFRVEFWRDGEWFFGRLAEVPSVTSQAETLLELMDNMASQFPVATRPGARLILVPYPAPLHIDAEMDR